MRTSLIAVAMLAAGVAMSMYGGTMDIREPMSEPLLYSGIGLALVSLVVFCVAWRSSRRKAVSAAAQSTDAVARWQVHADDMKSFRALERAREGRLWSLDNYLKFPDPVPAEGFPIVFGEKSLLFGDKLYKYGLDELGGAGEVVLHEGQPGFLEISTYLETTNAPLIIVLRIPVPAAAREQAVRALAHVESQIKPRQRARLHATFRDHFEAAGQATDAPHRMQRRRKVVLPLIALFCLALGAFIFFKLLTRQPSYLANETFPTLPNETAPSSVDPAYPPLANETDPLLVNEIDAPTPPG